MMVVLNALDLEGQVVGTTLTRRFLSRWEGRGGSIGCRWEGRDARSDTSHRGTGHGRHLSAHHIVGTDIIKPTALVFVGIDIELDGDILVHLDIELLDPVFPKNAEHATLGILARDLYHIVLRHPRVTCAG